MKKYILLISTFLCIFSFAQAQDDNDNVRQEFFLGYARTCYDQDFINDGQTGYIPLGFRCGAQLLKGDLFIGGEIQLNAYAPTFKMKHPYTDELAFTSKYRHAYTGAFGRYYIAGLPVFAQAGFGLYFNNRLKIRYEKEYLESEPWLYDETDKLRGQKIKYKNLPGFNVGAGAKLGPAVFMVSYQYHQNVLKDDATESTGYKAADFMFSVGIGM